MSEQEEDQEIRPTTSLISALDDNNGGSDQLLEGSPTNTETRGPLARTSICASSLSGPSSNFEWRIKRRRNCWFIGGILAATLSAVVLLDRSGYHLQLAESDRDSLQYEPWLPWLVRAVQFPTRPSTAKAILDYLDLFRFANNSPQIHIRPSKGQRRYLHQRHLSMGSSSGGDTVIRGSQLVVAGKMTVEDAPCNIAQLNLKTNEWSLAQRIQLSLYNSYSGGEVYSLLANHTFLPFPEDDDASSTR
jgi:hypothetical protein